MTAARNFMNAVLNPTREDIIWIGTLGLSVIILSMLFIRIGYIVPRVEQNMEMLNAHDQAIKKIVTELRIELHDRTSDRFTRSEFEDEKRGYTRRLMEANPSINRPTPETDE